MLLLLLPMFAETAKAMPLGSRQRAPSLTAAMADRGKRARSRSVSRIGCKRRLKRCRSGGTRNSQSEPTRADELDPPGPRLAGFSRFLRRLASFAGDFCERAWAPRGIGRARPSDGQGATRSILCYCWIREGLNPFAGKPVEDPELNLGERRVELAQKARATIGKKASELWWTFFVRGGIALLLGIAALFWPTSSISILLRLFGLFLVLDAAFWILGARRTSDDMASRAPVLLTGIIGLALLFVPAISARSVFF